MIIELLDDAVEVSVANTWEAEAEYNGATQVGHSAIATAWCQVVEVLADAGQATTFEIRLRVGTAQRYVSIKLFLFKHVYTTVNEQ